MWFEQVSNFSGLQLLSPKKEGREEKMTREKEEDKLDYSKIPFNSLKPIS